MVLIEVEQNPYLNAWNFLRKLPCHEGLLHFVSISTDSSHLLSVFWKHAHCTRGARMYNSIQSLFVVTPKHSLDCHRNVKWDFLCHIIILSPEKRDYLVIQGEMTCLLL